MRLNSKKYQPFTENPPYFFQKIFDKIRPSKQGGNPKIKNRRKREMKRKVVSTLLCAAMVSTMLVGCGGGADNAASGDAAATEEGGDAAEAARLPSDFLR